MPSYKIKIKIMLGIVGLYYKSCKTKNQLFTIFAFRPTICSNKDAY